MQETQESGVRFPGGEDPLEEGMATHSSILAWRIPWTQEPGRIRSLGWQRVGHDPGTSARMLVIPTQALEHSHSQGKQCPPGTSSDMWSIV